MTYRELWQKLIPIYGEHEARSIARMVFERQFGLSLTDICTGKDKQLSTNDCKKAGEIAARLLRNEPVQYILGSETFCGREFNVGPGVLIPRPETALLPQLAGEYCRNIPYGPDILDIGTGSGCIAVSMALDIPKAKVTAWDISPAALHIAEKNASILGAEINVVMQDIMHAPQDTAQWDIIVSNPPYICQHERHDMSSNVLDYEPETALFVPDNDPLLFYRAIAGYAVTAMKKGGLLLFEINPLYAGKLSDMLRKHGFEKVETVHDMFGKERFAKAIKS